MRTSVPFPVRKFSKFGICLPTLGPASKCGPGRANVSDSVKDQVNTRTGRVPECPGARIVAARPPLDCFRDVT